MDAEKLARETQITQGFRNLEKSIAELSEKESKLKERLSKALTPADPKGKEADDRPETDLCSMAITLKTLHRGIADVIDSIDNTLKRLEL